MTLAAVVSPYQPINGLTGLGLNDGALYIGVDGQDPETNPQACYWDAAGTILAAQPIQILGGYPMRLGTPTRLYTGNTYSIRVRDASGSQVFYEAHAVPAPTTLTGVFPSRAAAQAASIPAAIQTVGVTLQGYYAAGDGGGGFYRYSAGMPSSPARFQSADGAWWVLSDPIVNVLALGADPTGAADSSTAINNALQIGGAVFFPPTGSFMVAAPLTVSVTKSRLYGGGYIFSTVALAQAALLTLAADDITVEGLRLANPTRSQSQTGGKNIGVSVAAHRCRVVRNSFDSFQNSIAVAATGEFYDTEISFNNLTNCIGAGDGPGNSVSTFGEDRGDGIVSWGARTRIIGNYVAAAAGQDCRIGIHCEGLETLDPTPGPMPASVAVIVGNIVVGSFRRGIVSEDVSKVVIADNILPGGYTWWGIAVVQAASDVQVKNNVVVYDRVTTDHSGAAWAPTYCAIWMSVYSNTIVQLRPKVVGNSVLVTNGGGAGIYQNSAGVPANVRGALIQSNHVEATVATGTSVGIGGTQTQDQAIIDNDVVGPFRYSVYATACVRFTVQGNRFKASTSWAASIENASSYVTLEGNVVSGSANGFQTPQATDVLIANNRFDNVTSRAALLAPFQVPGLLCRHNYCGEGDGGILSSGATNFDIRDNQGFVSDVTLPPSALADKTHWVNTWGKHKGKTVAVDGSGPYVSFGPGATDQWQPCALGAAITPA